MPVEWSGRRLHRTLQEFTDRHRRPRKFAKNPVVFGQEPGRDLFQSREQRPFVLTAIHRHRSTIPDRCLDARPGRPRGRIGCGTGWRDRERLARARLGLCERALLRPLIAARWCGLRRLRKLRRRGGCQGGRHAFRLAFGLRPRAFAKERLIIPRYPRALCVHGRHLHDRCRRRCRSFDLAEKVSAERARQPRPRDLDELGSELGQKSKFCPRFQTTE